MWYLTSLENDVIHCVRRLTSCLRLKDVTITCKRMQRSLSIGGSSSVQWRKVGRSWRLRMCFLRLLCVRIEIDQPQCVNCWVIIHCLSVSCTKINHSRCALVIWSSLQLTSKQWIITQQFTARADLFLKFNLVDMFVESANVTGTVLQKWSFCWVFLPQIIKAILASTRKTLPSGFQTRSYPYQPV